MTKKAHLVHLRGRDYLIAWADLVWLWHWYTWCYNAWNWAATACYSEARVAQIWNCFCWRLGFLNSFLNNCLRCSIVQFANSSYFFRYFILFIRIHCLDVRVRDTTSLHSIFFLRVRIIGVSTISVDTLCFGAISNGLLFSSAFWLRSTNILVLARFLGASLSGLSASVFLFGQLITILCYRRFLWAHITSIICIILCLVVILVTRLIVCSSCTVVGLWIVLIALSLIARIICLSFHLLFILIVSCIFEIICLTFDFLIIIIISFTFCSICCICIRLSCHDFCLVKLWLFFSWWKFLQLWTILAFCWCRIQRLAFHYISLWEIISFRVLYFLYICLKIWHHSWNSLIFAFRIHLH